MMRGKGVYVAWAAVTLLVGACNLGALIDPIVNTAQSAIDQIDEAVAQLNNQSTSWQQVLQDLEGKLVGDAQSTIRTEVQTLLTNSIASVQVGAMCSVDFVGQRVKQALLALKAKLLGQTPPVPQPVICVASPLFVEFEAWQQRRIPVVTFTGFDLKAPLQVKLVETNRTVDATASLAGVSQYQATLNMGTTGGVPLTAQSLRMVVSANGSPTCSQLNDPACSTITIVHLPKICRESDRPVTPASIGFVPPNHPTGDKDYSGNGPHVFARVSLQASGQSVSYQVFMRARETKSDWTTVEGSGGGTLSLIPPLPAGLKILSINGPTMSEVTYTDQNHTDDFESPSNGGPVRKFAFVGDTSGDDVGRTRLKEASFNPLSLHVVETVDCVTATEARSMMASPTHLSPTLLEHLRRELATPP
jgi:hypothetical protein